MQETWKDIEGYEGMYCISTNGVVISLSRLDNRGRKVKEKILTQTLNGDQYYRVSLSKNGETLQVFVHKLVAQTFIPNPDNKKVANHIDGDKSNNSVDNLEWVTTSENVKHSWDIGLRKNNDEGGMRVKLLPDQIQWILNTYVYGCKVNGSEAIAKKLGISPRRVLRILHRSKK